MAEEKVIIKENISSVELETEMQRSYIDYAMSVIVGRALPDVRDGLKPVHRRILYAMMELGLESTRSYKKSARIVGEVMGKYHPHGDLAIYESLCRMAQEFALRYTLVNGQGNFGSIDGDPPAAMRYTEAKLESIAGEILADLEKETVAWQPNFDETLQEPLVLPSKVPNLLINGSTGIAVGMATNIPPHNLTEVAEALIIMIEHPDTPVEDLIKVMPGPDFPSGGFILGTSGIESAYRTGHGLIMLQSKTDVEDLGHHRQAIIVTELPYEVNKANLVAEIAELSNNKAVDGISTVRDESDKDGIRVVIELKTGENPDLVLNQLYKHSRLRITYGINNLALVNGRPRVLTLPELLNEFLGHRRTIIIRRTQYDLRKAQERLHILEGYLIALASIDKVIALIKSSRSVPEAREGLQKKFKLSEKQADAILAMPLSRLTGLEQEKIRTESDELKKKVAEYSEILADATKVNRIIKTELNDLVKRYGDKRKTEILPEAAELSEKDLIKPEDILITLSASGYIKRLPLDTYRRQHRGGRGILASASKEEDYLKDMILANTLDYLLFFTNLGRVYWLYAYQVPEQSRQSKGRPIINLLRLQDKENITAIIPVPEFSEGSYLFMATLKGVVKKTPLRAFSRPRAGGIIALALNPGDHLSEVKLTDGTYDVFLTTRNGMAIRFKETDVRSMGRTACGVRGIRLSDNDVVVGAEALKEPQPLLTVAERGYGKRTNSNLYRLQHRGGKGVIDIQTDKRNGKVVTMKMVRDTDEILILSQRGQAIRIKGDDIRCISRNTKGVKLINLVAGDKISDLVVNECAAEPEAEQAEE